MIHPSSAQSTPTAPDDNALACLHAAIAAADRDPWLASVWLCRPVALRQRFAEIGERLRTLPRRLRRGLARRWAKALPAAVLMIALGTWVAEAATITVAAGQVVVSPNGQCSLREAIVNANNDAATHPDCAAGSGADTIVLPAASTFNVQNIDHVANGGNGLPTITSAITIDGNGATIRRDGAVASTFRLFHVVAGGDLTLDETIVSGGVADDPGIGAYGGAILGYGGTVSLINGTLVSGSSAAYGGGIHIYTGSVGITASTISGNTAANGGGLYVLDGRMDVVTGTISINLAADGGGGVFARGSTGSVAGSTITGNSAAAEAGGLFNRQGTLTVTGGTISGNTVGAAGVGGGAVNRDGALSVVDSTISGNVMGLGGSGGGIFNRTGLLRVTNSTVSGHQVDGYGGGIYNRAGTAELTGSTISGNSAGLYGGGIYSRDGVERLTNSTVSGNTAEVGGGINGNLLADLTLTHSTVTDNTATSGGGIFQAGTSRLAGTIVADQAAGSDCAGAGTVVSDDYNLDSDGTCDLIDAHDIPSGEAHLGPLTSGPPGDTASHRPFENSQALDTIPNGVAGCGTTLADDQRGVARPQNGACDVGAVEAEIPGDCNADRLLDAADLPAITLRIFGAGFAENAACNANSDAVVDAGDLSCAARVIFLGRGACISP